ncbi:MAG: hypothetical protein EAZ09_16190 [Oscillatoriales cyanobacterium]|nr:MAG: hypothetical protein EAZ09_16190 [Oscillatoriales cyanobacterium]
MKPENSTIFSWLVLVCFFKRDRTYWLGRAGLLRLSVGDIIDRRTRPYKFDAIFYHPYFTMLVGAGSPRVGWGRVY